MNHSDLAVRNPAVAERQAEAHAHSADIEDFRYEGILVHLGEQSISILLSNETFTCSES